MPQMSERVRALLDGSAGLVCLFAAGWALACMQSGHMISAEVLAVVAASIPSVALLLRLRGVLIPVPRRAASAKDGAVALGPK